jgi:hypothetical protein
LGGRPRPQRERAARCEKGRNDAAYGILIIYGFLLGHSVGTF